MILLTSYAAKRGAFDHIFAFLCVSEVLLVDIGGDSARKDGVAAYIILSEGDCTTLH